MLLDGTRVQSPPAAETTHPALFVLSGVRRRRTRSPVARTLFALIVVGVGVWLIATSGHSTKTATAVVSASYLPYPDRAEEVSFAFEDGSKQTEVSPTADGFFEAVARFGPGLALVTRNAANNSIYKVNFHGKSYTLSSPGEEIGGGIIAVVLGLLGLAYVVVTSRRQ